MSNSRKHVRPHANAGSDGIVTREHGRRRLRKATTLTIAGAIAVAGVTTALASQVPSHHAARTSSGGVASSAAAIAAAQQAASNASGSNATSSNSGSTYVPSSAQSAPVASSGGS